MGLGNHLPGKSGDGYIGKVVPASNSIDPPTVASILQPPCQAYIVHIYSHRHLINIIRYCLVLGICGQGLLYAYSHGG